MEKNNDLTSRIKNILLKKAEGYFYDEKIEEYQQLPEENKSKSVSEQLSFEFDDLNLKPDTPAKKKSKMKLVKKKVTTLYQPPDLAAIKMLMDLYLKDEEQDLEKLTNEELLHLRDELVEKLKKF